MSDSTSSVPLYVVDASVAVKWVLRDEPDTQPADALLADFREGRVQLVAPVHLCYEVPSAVCNAVRSRRLSSIEGRVAVDDFLSWKVPTVDDSELIAAGYDQALRFGCSLYDGTYLALAEQVSGILVHADLRLRNGLGTSFPRALWLSDYLPYDRPTAG